MNYEIGKRYTLSNSVSKEAALGLPDGYIEDHLKERTLREVDEAGVPSDLGSLETARIEDEALNLVTFYVYWNPDPLFTAILALKKINSYHYPDLVFDIAISVIRTIPSKDRKLWTVMDRGGKIILKGNGITIPFEAGPTVAETPLRW